MSAMLAHNWWAVGLRGVAAALFAIDLVVLPPTTLASLLLVFGAYIAADGALAFLAGVRAAQRDERWPLLMLEGATNLLLAGVVLVWPVVALVPFAHLVSFWAIATGALLLAAARRLSISHGRLILALAGVLSATWGALAAFVDLSGAGSGRMGVWLVGYAVLFGLTLLVLAGVLQRQHRLAGSLLPNGVSQ